MSNELLPQSEIILYQTEDGRTRVQCRFENETVWLSLNQMVDLFQRDNERSPSGFRRCLCRISGLMGGNHQVESNTCPRRGELASERTVSALASSEKSP